MYEFYLYPPDKKELFCGTCDGCGFTFIKGEDITHTNQGTVHDECFPEFAKKKLNARRSVAGGD